MSFQEFRSLPISLRKEILQNCDEYHEQLRKI
jgi:hypothetical protein